MTDTTLPTPPITKRRLKDRINDVDKWLENHKVGLAYTAGSVISIASTFYVMRTFEAEYRAGYRLGTTDAVKVVIDDLSAALDDTSKFIKEQGLEPEFMVFIGQIEPEDIGL